MSAPRRSRSISSDPYVTGASAAAGGGGKTDGRGRAQLNRFPKITQAQLDAARRTVAYRATDVDDALELADMLGIKPSQVKGSRYIEGETSSDRAEGARRVPAYRVVKR